MPAYQHRGAMVVPVAMLAVCLLAALGAARAQDTGAQRDARQALPQPKDLTGFGECHHTSFAGNAMLRAVREADGLAMHATVWIGKDSVEVEMLRKQAATDMMGLPGTMPSGTRSGRQVGNQTWHSRYHRGGPPRGSYTFGCRLGRAIIAVDLMHKISPGAGKPVHPIFSEADLRWAEDVAIGCVERLKKMGYGDEAERKAQSKAKGGKKPKGK
ncbi:MAG: hypothetical protein FJX72_06505 [Armatimonadetes bacterium]|nr:hypothetical protein [Armatimonadota bacterium]